MQRLFLSLVPEPLKLQILSVTVAVTVVNPLKVSNPQPHL